MIEIVVKAVKEPHYSPERRAANNTYIKSYSTTPLLG
nr:MAG TPA: hypothetical protein [Caudoviricetes sp.]